MWKPFSLIVLFLSLFKTHFQRHLNCSSLIVKWPFCFQYLQAFYLVVQLLSFDFYNRSNCESEKIYETYAWMYLWYMVHIIWTNLFIWSYVGYHMLRILIYLNNFAWSCRAGFRFWIFEEHYRLQIHIESRVPSYLTFPFYRVRFLTKQKRIRIKLSLP